MLEALQERGLLKAGGKQRTDSTHIVGAIRALNRLELVGETLRQALNSLGAIEPDWLQSWVPIEWYERYGVPINGYRLPKEQDEQDELALLIGLDGIRLLSAIDDSPEQTYLRNVPALRVLRQVWFQQYYFDENGALAWRSNKETPPASMRVVSPVDAEARQGKKRTTRWLGYKVHLTETCDPDAPKLISNVETRIACQQDIDVTEDIHHALAEKELLPKQHVVDTAYVSGPQLVTSEKKYGIELLGPVRPDTSWQAQDAEAYDVTKFQFDWGQKRATCPQGQVSRYWKPRKDRHGKPIISIVFSVKQCRPCPAKKHCTIKSKQGRHLTLRPQAAHEAIQARRKYQETDEFRKAYALRAGVEGVISQAVHALGSRRARYRGLKKTHFQHLATATAINLRRAARWLSGYDTASTPATRFAGLAPC
jgi:transposase